MATPRILFYDIETEPNLGYTWEKYEQNVLHFVKEGGLLSVAYKWAGESTVKCMTREGEKTDKKLTQHIHDLFREADIIVAHNGDEFDYKKCTARMLFYGLPPVKPVHKVDTKKAAKCYFKFNGNGLNDLAQFLKLGSKVKHSGFDMWLGCMNDSPKAWREMAFYNKMDVRLLEEVYEKLKPWIIRHPNIARMMNCDLTPGTCPKCNSENTTKQGYRANMSGSQQQWQCSDCLSWFLTKRLKVGL